MRDYYLGLYQDHPILMLISIKKKRKFEELFLEKNQIFSFNYTNERKFSFYNKINILLLDVEDLDEVKGWY